MEAEERAKMEAKERKRIEVRFVSMAASLLWWKPDSRNGSNRVLSCPLQMVQKAREEAAVAFLEDAIDENHELWSKDHDERRRHERREKERRQLQEEKKRKEDLIAERFANPITRAEDEEAEKRKQLKARLMMGGGPLCPIHPVIISWPGAYPNRICVVHNAAF